MHMKSCPAQRLPLPLIALLIGACTPESSSLDGFTATTDDAITTLVHVSGTTDTAATVTVDYGLTDAYGSSLALSTSAASEHAGTLLGLKADTDWHWRVRAMVDGVEQVGPDNVARTGSLPDDLPPLASATMTAERPAEAAFLVTSYFETMSATSYPLVLDAQQNVVWFAELEGQVLEARISRDRLAMVMVVKPFGPSEGDGVDSRFVRMPLDGSPTTEWVAPGAHHAFVETDSGFALVAGDLRNIDGKDVQGDMIVEIDADGNLTTIWNAFDHLEVVENDGWSMEPADWTHANGIDLNAAGTEYLLSLYRMDTVYAIDRRSGATLYSVGAEGQMRLDADGTFGPQHGPRWTDDGIVMFDNHYGGQSRILGLTLDFQNHAAPTAFAFAPQPFDVSVMGAVDLLPESGQVLSTWGEEGWIYRTEQDGTVLEQMTFGSLGVVGDITAVPSLYP
jgi:hypothetical protein